MFRNQTSEFRNNFLFICRIRKKMLRQNWQSNLLNKIVKKLVYLFKTQNLISNYYYNYYKDIFKAFFSFFKSNVNRKFVIDL